MSHYLHFATRDSAKEVTAILAERRIAAGLQPAENDRWTVVARHLLADWRGNRVPPGEYFEAIARHFDGQYGGWEIGPAQMAP